MATILDAWQSLSFLFLYGASVVGVLYALTGLGVRR